MSKTSHYWATRNAAMASITVDRRFWVFVWNNPTSVDIPKEFKDVDTVWWQLEKGKKSGRLHLQGVVQFRFPKSRGQVRDMCDAWWAPMEGRLSQARAYCTKEETRQQGPWMYSPVAEALLQAASVLARPSAPAPPLGLLGSPNHGVSPYASLPASRSDTLGTSTTLPLEPPSG